jgi:hypothetical protein
VLRDIRPTHPGSNIPSGSIKCKDTKFLTAAIRLFADSGVGDKGMTYYTVIYGAEGKHRVVPRQRSAPVPKVVKLSSAAAR